MFTRGYCSYIVHFWSDWSIKFNPILPFCLGDFMITYLLQIPHGHRDPCPEHTGPFAVLPFLKWKTCHVKPWSSLDLPHHATSPETWKCDHEKPVVNCLLSVFTPMKKSWKSIGRLGSWCQVAWTIKLYLGNFCWWIGGFCCQMGLPSGYLLIKHGLLENPLAIVQGFSQPRTFIYRGLSQKPQKVSRTLPLKFIKTSKYNPYAPWCWNMNPYIYPKFINQFCR